eukprot:4049906-Amphidinium_carterae.1
MSCPASARPPRNLQPRKWFCPALVLALRILRHLGCTAQEVHQKWVHMTTTAADLTARSPRPAGLHHFVLCHRS